jgi:hypothetical protein
MGLYSSIIWELTVNRWVSQEEETETHGSAICGKLSDDRIVYAPRTGEPDAHILLYY